MFLARALCQTNINLISSYNINDIKEPILRPVSQWKCREETNLAYDDCWSEFVAYKLRNTCCLLGEFQCNRFTTNAGNQCSNPDIVWISNAESLGKQALPIWKIGTQHIFQPILPHLTLYRSQKSDFNSYWLLYISALVLDKAIALIDNKLLCNEIKSHLRLIYTWIRLYLSFVSWKISKSYRGSRWWLINLSA